VPHFRIQKCVLDSVPCPPANGSLRNNRVSKRTPPGEINLPIFSVLYLVPNRPSAPYTCRVIAMRPKATLTFTARRPAFRSLGAERPLSPLAAMPRTFELLSQLESLLTKQIPLSPVESLLTKTPPGGGMPAGTLAQAWCPGNHQQSAFIVFNRLRTQFQASYFFASTYALRGGGEGVLVVKRNWAPLRDELKTH